MQKITSLKNNKKSLQRLQSYLNQEGNFPYLEKILEQIPIYDKGIEWKKLLLNFEDDIAVFAQSLNPKIRLASFSILIHSEKENTKRLIWDSFLDDDKDIRIYLISNFKSQERQKLYNILFQRYLNDAVMKVRSAALQRIKQNFSDIYTIEIHNLSIREKIHCIELLDPSSAYDHNLALQFMYESHDGIILAASLFLERAGTLNKLLRTASLKDETDFNRRKQLLSIAAKHQVVSFLDKEENLVSQLSLSLAIEIYSEGIHSPAFSKTVRKIFALKGNDYSDLKKNTLHCLINRKDNLSQTIMADLLKSEAQHDTYCPVLLKNLNPDGAFLYYPVLKNFLLDPHFKYWDSLKKAFSIIPLSLCLSDLYSLVQSTDVDLLVRSRCIHLLSSYGDRNSLLFLLENLHLYNPEELNALSYSIQQWDSEELHSFIKSLYNECDSSVQQNLMRLTADAGLKTYIPEIVKRLSDAVPETRSTAIRCLVQMDQKESFHEMICLLHDPQESVRANAAAVFVEWNYNDLWDEMAAILQDTHDSRRVQHSVLQAMKASSEIKIIPILCTAALTNPEIQNEIIHCLKEKNTEHDLQLLVQSFSNNGDSIPDFYQKLFESKGQLLEKKLLKMIKENPETKLISVIATIFENIGFIETLSSRLRNPRPSVRLEAAETLSLIPSAKAGKALLMGAKDIKKEIRILCLKALVKLENDNGFLQDFIEDPDKKVRRYALWAKERLKAVELP